MPAAHTSRSLRGFTLVEAVIVLALVLGILMVIALVLPGARESARSTQCQKHLKDLGESLVAYDHLANHLPTAAFPNRGQPSPQALVLGDLGLARFADVSKTRAPASKSGAPPLAHPIADLLCPSDSVARQGAFPAPVSYRATTGDTPLGDNGPFALGQRIRLSDVAAADGTEHTAGFSERLIGLGTSEDRLENYARVPAPVGGSTSGCGATPADSWRGDAGSNWSLSDWTSTLYTHTVGPNARPSCIAIDEETAHMGASSAHLGLVHVLLLDGHVRAIRTTIDLSVWRALSTPRTGKSNPAPAISP